MEDPGDCSHHPIVDGEASHKHIKMKNSVPSLCDFSSEYLVSFKHCNLTDKYKGKKRKRRPATFLGDSSHYHHVPLKPGSGNGEVNYKHKKRKPKPALSFEPNFGLSDTSEMRELDPYNHSYVFCVQQPTIINWLSEIPDDVISLILSFLPIEEAARSCVLSKRWRGLWLFMPNISLPKVTSVDTITNRLQLFRSSCVSLRLNLHRVLGRFPTNREFDTWMVLACSRRIEDLELKLDFNGGCSGGGPCKPRIRHSFELPVAPGLSTLKRLTLAYCMIGPRASICLTSLKYLVLDRVHLEENMVEELTSSCPVLEELELRECNSNVPFWIRITNPKMSKLTIHDMTFGKPRIPLLKLEALYLSTLVLVYEAGRRYQLNVPSLSTMKFVKFGRGFVSHAIPSLTNIVSGLNTLTELHLCWGFLISLGKDCCASRQETVFEPLLLTNIKRLHLRFQYIIKELPGLVYFLNFCDGIETLVLNFENICSTWEPNDMRKHVRYLHCRTVFPKGTKDISHKFMTRDKEVQVEEKAEHDRFLQCLDDKNSWRFLRFLLSCRMPNLKCMVINGFKRMLFKSGKRYYNNCEFGVKDYLVDKYELKLLRLLLKNHSMTLENITVRTKDVYLEEVAGLGNKKSGVRTYKRKNVYLDGEINKMDISPWNKVLLSSIRISSRAKLNVIYS